MFCNIFQELSVSPSAVNSLNDNLASVLLAEPAFLPALPLAKFNFDVLILLEGPELHSIAFSDDSRCDIKKI